MNALMMLWLLIFTVRYNVNRWKTLPLKIVNPNESYIVWLIWRASTSSSCYSSIDIKDTEIVLYKIGLSENITLANIQNWQQNSKPMHIKIVYFESALICRRILAENMSISWSNLFGARKLHWISEQYLFHLFDAIKAIIEYGCYTFVVVVNI